MEFWSLRSLCVFPKYFVDDLEKLRNFFRVWQYILIYLEFIFHIQHTFEEILLDILLLRRRQRMEGCRKSSHAGVACAREGGGDGDGDFFNNILTSSENQVCLDGDLGTKVLFWLSAATWLKYTKGSSLLFWQWPKGFQREAARKGYAPCFLTFPKNLLCQ